MGNEPHHQLQGEDLHLVRMVHRLLLAGLLLLGTITVPVRAQDASRGAVGTWTSSTGNTFKIPRSRSHFDLIITTTNGLRMIGQGAWVQYPNTFTYTVSGVSGSSVCTFDGQGIKVQGPGGTSYWRRLGH